MALTSFLYQHKSYVDGVAASPDIQKTLGKRGSLSRIHKNGQDRVRMPLLYSGPASASGMLKQDVSQPSKTKVSYFPTLVMNTPVQKLPQLTPRREHVWRFIKPFKCPNCGEGFGREKTKAIHCLQRKTPCIATSTPSEYEGSPNHRRDQRIETAKSTHEMIKIFEDYEKG